MKKLLAAILALTMVLGGGAAVYAEESTAEDVMLISEEAAPEYIADKMVIEGTVKSVSEEQIEIDNFALNIDDNTRVWDTDLVPTEVKEGDLITAVVSTMTTRSLPPQAYAFYITVRKSAEDVAPMYMTVDKVADGFIYSEDGNYEVSYENAEVAMYRTKNIVKAEELTKGSEIFVYAEVMTMSIPALVNPTKITILNIKEAEEIVEEDAELPVAEEVILDKTIYEGAVKAVTEEQIELEDFVLNIDSNTLVAGADLIPTQVKAGDKVTAVVSTMTTRSLPPQAYAFYVIVQSEEKAAPIFMTVDRVEEGLIYSADRKYKVSYENAQVGMYRTKNIVKAEELTKGSEIFVYADIMTMSLPALVNPSEIVIMSIAQPSKAELLSKDGILLGTENGLELDRQVSRAEAVALITRTTASEKMVYTSDFSDVPTTHWAYASISWALNKNIVAGVGGGKFEPDRTVTAKELAMMLLNAMGETTDFDKAFETAVEKGLVEEADLIEETDVLSRENTAKMIYNYINK